MIKSLFTIRYKQALRACAGLGFVRTIIFLMLLGFVGLAIFRFSEEATAQYVAFGTLALLLYIQLQRKDKQFLKTHFDNSKNILLAEYLLVASPAIGCLLFHGQWIETIEIFVALPLIIQADFKTKGKSLNTRLQRFIPYDCYEWKAGLRKQFFVIVPIWILASVTSFFVGSVPIALLVLGIFNISLFEKGEPYQMLQAMELGSKAFIRQKITRAIAIFSIISLPLISLFLVFHFQYWYIPVIEYFVLVFLLAYAILTKYAFYEPNKKSPAAQTFAAIGAISGFISFLLPVVWVLSVRFYFKSINNLDSYLHDYN